MYLTGEIFDEDPWNRLGENALCRLNKSGPRRRRSSTSPSALIRGLLEVDPNERMTLDEAWEHPWCRRYALSLHYISLHLLIHTRRTSQLASQGPQMLADKITQSLRDNGDMDLAAPDFSRQSVATHRCTTQITDTTPETTWTSTCPPPRTSLNSRSRSCSSCVSFYSPSQPVFLSLVPIPPPLLSPCPYPTD